MRPWNQIQYQLNVRNEIPKYFEFYANICELICISIRLSIYLMEEIYTYETILFLFCAWWNLNNGTFAPIQLDIPNKTIQYFMRAKKNSEQSTITINTHIWNNERFCIICCCSLLFLFYGRSFSGNILRTCQTSTYIL